MLASYELEKNRKETGVDKFNKAAFSMKSCEQIRGSPQNILPSD